MAAGNFDTVVADAIAQVEAGAQMLDVNAGIPLADEPGILAHTVELVQSIMDVPLSIDSSIVEALEAGLAVYRGKALVNSVTGEDEQMERVLPLVARHGAAVVAITNDETGISEDPDVRFEVARKIVSRAEDHGIPREDVVVDPLVMPIGAMGTAGRQVFRLRPAAPRRAPRQHDVRRVERQLRAPEPDRAERRVPADGDRLGPHLGDHEPAARRDAPGDQGGRRDDGERPALRRVDRAKRRRRDGAVQRRPPRRARGAAERRRRHESAASRSATDADESDATPRRLHAVRPAGALAARHDGARRGPHARRRPRLGLRRPRDLRPLPGDGRRGRAREARDHLHGAALDAGDGDEQAYAADRGLAAGRRLGCTALVAEDVVIDVPPESQVYRQVVRKEADARSIAVDPVVRLYFVEVEEPELASPGATSGGCSTRSSGNGG